MTPPPVYLPFREATLGVDIVGLVLLALILLLVYYRFPEKPPVDQQ